MAKHLWQPFDTTLAEIEQERGRRVRNAIAVLARYGYRDSSEAKVITVTPLDGPSTRMHLVWIGELPREAGPGACLRVERRSISASPQTMPAFYITTELEGQQPEGFAVTWSDLMEYEAWIIDTAGYLEPRST